MIIEDNIDVLIDTEVGCLCMTHINSIGIYYEFEFYPETLN